MRSPVGSWMTNGLQRGHELVWLGSVELALPSAMGPIAPSLETTYASAVASLYALLLPRLKSTHLPSGEKDGKKLFSPFDFTIVCALQNTPMPMSLRTTIEPLVNTHSVSFCGPPTST